MAAGDTAAGQSEQIDAIEDGMTTADETLVGDSDQLRAAILTEAEADAERILSDAEAEAERVIRATERQLQARREAAQAEAKRIIEEARATLAIGAEVHDQLGRLRDAVGEARAAVAAFATAASSSLDHVAQVAESLSEAVAAAKPAEGDGAAGEVGDDGDSDGAPRPMLGRLYGRG